MTDTTRRTLLRTGLGIAAASAAATARAQEEKVAKDLVQYQDTPKDGARCDQCTNWVDPNACKVVQGNISPAGWCVAFQPKEG